MTAAVVPPGLAGRRILVVEDQYVIASELTRLLERNGAEVVGPHPHAHFEPLDAGPLDLALLDINLRGEMVFDLAVRLRAAGVPILFLTGYGPGILPEALSNLPCLPKPVEPRRLLAAVDKLLAATLPGPG